MNIDLVYPGLVNLGFNSIGKGGMNTNWISLGLAYLGAILRREGHQVRLHDLRALQGWDDLAGLIETGKPDIVGVQFNTPNLNLALESCRIAKRTGRLVIAGGPHATIDAEGILASGVVDYVITGEAETSLPELLRALQENQVPTQRVIAGKKIDDLDSLPFPAWDLFPIDRILNRRGSYPFLNNGLPIMASRGCPANCSFCQPLVRNMFGKTVRYRSPENIIAELQALIKRYNVTCFSFQDDTLTANKAWILNLCQKMTQAGINLQWSAQSRVDTFDEEIAIAMKKAGCVCLFFGFESGSQRMLNLYRKGITPEKSRRAARICRKTGLIIFADFIFGGPTETLEEMQQTVDLIRDIRPELPSPTFFTPIPGCDLHEYCKQRGIILNSGAENFDRSPQGQKIHGVDYVQVQRCVAEAISATPRWFDRPYLARLALKRWLGLIRHGEVLVFLKELLDKSLHEGSVFQTGLKNLYRRVVGK